MGIQFCITTFKSLAFTLKNQARYTAELLRAIGQEQYYWKVIKKWKIEEYYACPDGLSQSRLTGYLELASVLKDLGGSRRISADLGGSGWI